MLLRNNHCEPTHTISNRLIDYFNLATQQTGLAPHQKVSLRYLLKQSSASRTHQNLPLNTSIPRHQQKMKDFESMRV